MKLKSLALAVALAAGGWSGMANASLATNASGTLTADNEFWFYTGNAAGSNLSFVGEGHDWQQTFSFNFTVHPGDFLYVLAHDTGQPHAWQGTFSTPVGDINTNTTQWTGATVQSTTISQSMIANAVWGPIQTDLANSSGPWGSRVGNPAAHWIWTSDPNSSDVTVLFRTVDPVRPVPLPGAFVLMVPALGVLTAARKRVRS